MYTPPPQHSYAYVPQNKTQNKTHTQLLGWKESTIHTRHTHTDSVQWKHNSGQALIYSELPQEDFIHPSVTTNSNCCNVWVHGVTQWKRHLLRQWWKNTTDKSNKSPGSSLLLVSRSPNLHEMHTSARLTSKQTFGHFKRLSVIWLLTAEERVCERTNIANDCILNRNDAKASWSNKLYSL